MFCWKITLLALVAGVPLQAFAFLGMNVGATLQGPLPAWTRQMGSKGAPKQTNPGTIAIDSSGNAYITGYTNGGLDGNTLTGTQDYFLTKYDSSGAKVWTVQKGIASSSIEAYGVATDSSGNVAISGNTGVGLDGNTQTGSQDFFVVKYDSTGTRLWTQQLGVASKATYGNAVAIDSSGNVFVGGNTSGGLDGNTLSGTNDSDAFVTKYNSTGTKLWTKQIGAAGQFTYGRGVATDSAGNVFLVGQTTGGLDGNPYSQNYDLFITKYDSSGNKQWTKQLGTSSMSATYGQAVATDSSGNIFAAGYTEAGLDGNTQTGTQDVFVTKYDTTGTRIWTRQLGVASQYTQGYGVSTDSTGNVVVTGATTGGLDGNTLTGTQDFFVIKYDSSGTKQWTRQLGVLSNPTQGNGIAADSSGNIRITGCTQGGLDGNNLIGTKDLFLTNYSSSGSKLWTKQKGAATGSAGTVSNAVTATDVAGNVYVAGTTNTGLDGNSLAGTKDFYLTKYNSTGVKQWTNELGVSLKITTAGGVSTDSSGNIFVVGNTSGNLDGNTRTGTSDLFVTKYNSSGTKLWTRQLGAATATTIAYAAATDSSGNVYLTGNTTGNLDGNTLSGASATDFFVTKYDSSGTKQWTKQMGAGASTTTYAYGIALDSSGNIFATGFTTGSIDGQTLTGAIDLFVVKFDNTGTKQWTRQFGATSATVNAYGAATDPSGNVLIAGSTNRGLDGNVQTGTKDFFVTKYDTTGTRLWTKQIGVSSSATEALAVTTDAFGNAYVAGDTAGGLDGNALTGFKDLFVTKYTSAGVAQWTKQMGISSAGSSASGTAIDSFGHLYVAGTTTGGLDQNNLTGAQDFFVCQYIGN